MSDCKHPKTDGIWKCASCGKLGVIRNVLGVIADLTNERDVALKKIEMLDTGNFNSLLDLERVQTATLQAKLDLIYGAIAPSEENARRVVETMNDTAGAIISGTSDQCDRAVAYAILRAISERAGRT